MIKDSGDRTQFETGAVRDIQNGKGRCDLLPLDVICILETSLFTNDDDFFRQMDRFMRTGNESWLYLAANQIIEYAFDDMETAILELSQHYEDGAEKYTAHNWRRGIPITRYIDSGVRHFLKHIRGDKDERHDRAALWNIVGAIWTMENKPELDDVDHAAYRGEVPKGQAMLEPARIASPDLRNMKGQMVYFVPYADDEKPRWMQVVLDFITNPAMKMWALYKNPDDFMYLSEIEDLGMVFTGECNPELTKDDLEKMDEQTVWVAPPKDQFKAMLHRISLSEDKFIDPNGQYFCIKDVFDGTDQLKGTKVYRYEKTND
ncbi:DUF5664 domain-containing protein [Eubacterium limosum]|uniref:dATP/dGTP diphosphohydrolase domain-containing protein n=1 Tax=Eubacterium limosum TaxID=1736 RepID=UPI001D092F8D|nr:dATP/dGTP diphosphohydrolase domain-containing protein [Eubacterium limosum]MCB6569510.1 DUF5664 domain-containing protein [Eubacterium limosum]